MNDDDDKCTYINCGKCEHCDSIGMCDNCSGYDNCDIHLICNKGNYDEFINLVNTNNININMSSALMPVLLPGMLTIFILGHIIMKNMKIFFLSICLW